MVLNQIKASKDISIQGENDTNPFVSKINEIGEDLNGQKFEFHFKGISTLRDGLIIDIDFKDRMFYLINYYGVTGTLSQYVQWGMPLFFEN